MAEPARPPRRIGIELAVAAAAALAAGLVVASWDDPDVPAPTVTAAVARPAPPRPTVRSLGPESPVVIPIRAPACDGPGAVGPVRASMGADATGCRIISTNP